MCYRVPSYFCPHADIGIGYPCNCICASVYLRTRELLYYSLYIYIIIFIYLYVYLYIYIYMFIYLTIFIFTLYYIFHDIILYCIYIYMERDTSAGSHRQHDYIRRESKTCILQRLATVLHISLQWCPPAWARRHACKPAACQGFGLKVWDDQ